jgi:transglutaminase-like putative cysteine protease
MTPQASDDFLRHTDVIDWDHPAVLQRARELADDRAPIDVVRACFEWVRDEVRHSCDFHLNPVTWRASDVLLHRTGFCYAKSHLLAALLRANSIRAGFCYQRLSIPGAGPPYSLHGFNGILLPEFGWHRVDARGNRFDVDAQFTPPVERLAFAILSPDEVEFSEILPDPLDCVVDALRGSATWEDALASLPDVSPGEWPSLGLSRRIA